MQYTECNKAGKELMKGFLFLCAATKRNAFRLNIQNLNDWNGVVKSLVSMEFLQELGKQIQKVNIY